jgi:hypothetical protein
MNTTLFTCRQLLSMESVYTGRRTLEANRPIIPLEMDLSPGLCIIDSPGAWGAGNLLAKQ